MRLLAETLRRAGAARSGIVLVADEGPLPFRDGAFDRVLVDAPCSGLGTVRRDPDIRWRRQELSDPDVVVVGDTAVLWCTVEHEMVTAEGTHRFKRRMTQTWGLTADGWRCVAGHAGHRVEV